MSEPISLGDAQMKASEDKLWTTRGKAVQAYANLEQSLCHLLGSLADVSDEIAGIIFYKIVNTGARTAILENLLKKKHKDTYREFWLSFAKLLRSTDQERNEIIHWNGIISVNMKDGSSELALMPPGVWETDLNKPRHTIDSILEFTRKCSFLARFCNMFVLTLKPPDAWPEEQQQTWRDICLQPIVYPPPESHPLFQTWREPASLPQTFLLK